MGVDLIQHVRDRVVVLCLRVLDLIFLTRAITRVLTKSNSTGSDRRQNNTNRNKSQTGYT